ncbi:hypothetical protein BH24ACT3_BH24ACT3_00420 [soil metagenome]
MSSPVLGRRAVLGGALALGALPFLSRFDARPASAAGDIRAIRFPVEGTVRFGDDFGDCRGGAGCPRRHLGNDLMGAKLQKLLAARDGTVTRLTVGHASAGNMLVLTDADGWTYHYLHINNDTPGTEDGRNPAEWRFAPGIAQGRKVSAGQHVAFLGDSGNAEATSPHLHFEMHRPDGTVVNPYPSLQAAKSGVVPPTVPASTFLPFESAAALAAQQYLDFLSRPPEAAGVDYWARELESGRRAPASVIHHFLVSNEFGVKMAPVVRLYFAFFNRRPDEGGMTYWLGRHRSGVSLDRIADQFAASSEFGRKYGDPDDGDFVNTVYRNVLGREPDVAGRAYWVDQIARGMTRGKVMTHFSESAEYRQAMETQVQVTMTYIGMLRRSPDDGGYLYWVDQLSRGTSLSRLIAQFFTSSEYHRRFA